jgi:hypothetical protein
LGCLFKGSEHPGVARILIFLAIASGAALSGLPSLAILSETPVLKEPPYSDVTTTDGLVNFAPTEFEHARY